MINKLLNFIDKSKSVFHFVDIMEKYLFENGYKKLDLKQKFNLKIGGKYFVSRGGAIVVFRVDDIENGFNIVVSHTDSPTLKIKSNPQIDANGYSVLNTEVYGGPIINTWYDKPLSIAGVLQCAQNGEVCTKLFDFEKAVCSIPNLAIHMNREVNNGVKIDKQKELRPIFNAGTELNKKEFLDMISKKSGVSKENILSYELNVYNTQPSVIFGEDDEFINAPRLDNLSMAISSIEGLLKNTKKSGINIAFCLDNEEIGSKTLNGGDSAFIPTILERVAESLKISKEEYFILLEKSLILSADLAHAIHPNFVEKADITNRPKINSGFVIKVNGNKRYATDSKGAARVAFIAKSNNIPYQWFYNNSNEVGGSSLGPISSSMAGINTVDIGNPILAMHSEREMGGVKDYLGIIELFKNFYGEKND